MESWWTKKRVRVVAQAFAHFNNDPTCMPDDAQLFTDLCAGWAVQPFVKGAVPETG